MDDRVLLVEIRENGVWSWEPVARQVDASDPPQYGDACFDAVCFSPDDLRDIAAEAGVGPDDIRMTLVARPEGWEY